MDPRAVSSPTSMAKSDWLLDVQLGQRARHHHDRPMGRCLRRRFPPHPRPCRQLPRPGSSLRCNPSRPRRRPSIPSWRASLSSLALAWKNFALMAAGRPHKTSGSTNSNCTCDHHPGVHVIRATKWTKETSARTSPRFALRRADRIARFARRTSASHPEGCDGPRRSDPEALEG